ncbi:sigma-E factor regulatory protein RseB domain-containing protein [Pseudonocardia ailaonensis]|uniref:Sigma-E factor regulatory protein RseB domain-containing protein n=1 Tax=Pseudonocardia ailaonensis TaxID=367279 RepID=A0ABN2MWZ8_9PSEU
MSQSWWARIGTGVAVAGVVGLGLLAVPAGAGAAPELPPVSPEDLVTSVQQAKPGPFNGTVELDNQLGLPAIPDVPQLANGTSTARVWSGGDGKGRVSLPSAQGEKTLVSDGTTSWAYDSADRTAVKSAAGAHPDADMTDPTRSAAEAITQLRQTSDVRVDGTAEVAGRPAYELVLTPKPTERTLLREVRIAVDAEKRIPLRLTVLANGSTDPAFELGFSAISYGPQDASLFAFTPPPGTTVKDGAGRPQTGAAKPEGAAPTVVGDGWDTVIVARMPAGQAAPDAAQGRARPEGTPNLAQLGTPVSGSWGSGRLITTAVAAAIVTDDGRVAVGAVPQQVLTEALAK